MGASAILSVRIISDNKDAKRDLKDTADAVERTETRMTKASRGMKRMGPHAAALGVGLLALGKSAFDAASEMQQSVGATEAVFGAAADQTKRYADAASQSLGLARAEYLSLSNVLGSQLTNMGVHTADLADETHHLVGMGADLAAQFGGSTSDAVSALSSLLKGEADPIERYGISIKQSDISARKATMGLTGLTGAADKAADRQAIMALLTEQSASATGAFGREAHTAAGQQQRANAEWQNAAATLGVVLLPIVTAGAQALGQFAGWVQRNADVVIPLIGVVAALAAGILVFNAAASAGRAVMAVATAAQWAWNVAMSANPIGIIIVAIGALVAAIIWCVQNWDLVKRVALRVWDAIVAATLAAGRWIARTAGNIAAWFGNTWTRVVRGWGIILRRIGSGIRSMWSWFAGIPRRLGGAMSAGARSAVAWWQHLYRSAIAGMRSLFTWFGSIPRRLGGAMSAGARSAVNWFRWLRDSIVGAIRNLFNWFAAIPGRIAAAFNVRPPGWLSSAARILGFSAPNGGALAVGGLGAPAPALATFGVGGTATAWPAASAGTATATEHTVNLNLHVTTDTLAPPDPVELGRHIADALREWGHSTGRTLTGVTS